MAGRARGRIGGRGLPGGPGAPSWRAAALFLAPMLLALATVAGWPLIRTIWFAFTDAQLDAMGEAGFVGIENFWNSAWGGLLADPAWWGAVRNTLIFAAISVGIETVLGVVFALVLNAAFTGRALVRAVVLIPWAIPTVVSAKIWAWMLHDQFGMVNDLLLRAGLISSPVAWLANDATAMAAVIAVDVWKTTPFMALLVLAALQVLPRNIYEAARIDGAGPVRAFFSITLPLIRPALTVAIIFRLLDALRVFDIVYVMTGTADETMTMSVFARQQLVAFQDVGYGSAASTLLFLTIAVVTAVVLTLGRVRLAETPR